MLSEFIDFVDSSLPNVSPDFRVAAKDAISQFEKDGHIQNYLLSKPLKEVSQGDIIQLKKNLLFDCMYLPDALISNKFIDFGTLNTYNKDLIREMLDKNKMRRIASLNQLGYYFFIIKLSVYLMRREDADTLERRKCKILVE